MSIALAETKPRISRIVAKNQKQKINIGKTMYCKVLTVGLCCFINLYFACCNFLFPVVIVQQTGVPKRLGK